MKLNNITKLSVAIAALLIAATPASAEFKLNTPTIFGGIAGAAIAPVAITGLAVGAGVGYFISDHEAKQDAKILGNAQDIAINRAGLNVIHANSPALFEKNEASIAAYQAPTCNWMDGWK